MACNPDFVQFIVDQCSGAGEAVLDEVVLRPDAVEVYPTLIPRRNRD